MMSTGGYLSTQTWTPENIPIKLLMAMDPFGVIGLDGKLPWYYPEDLEHFRNITSEPNSAVVMGRITWESLPVGKSGEKLPGRKKIVGSRSLKDHKPLKNTIFFNNIWEHELYKAVRPLGIKTIYVIGGEQLFREAMYWADELIVTQINKAVDTKYTTSVSRINMGHLWSRFDKPYRTEQLSDMAKVEYRKAKQLETPPLQANWGQIENDIFATRPIRVG